MVAIIAKKSWAEIQLSKIERDGMRELFATQARATVASLAPIVRDLGANPGTETVCAQCFGAPQSEFDGPAGAACTDGIAVPLTWILGASSGDGLGGVHVHAVTDASVRILELDGRPVGSVVEGPYGDEVILAGIHDGNVAVPPTEQARATFRRIEQALELAGMDYSHVVRTWLYLDDILSWYADFNGVRTAFYTESGVFDRMVPASTGIGASNQFGAAVIAGVQAIRPKSPEVRIEAVPSPLQCPALKYGSSFSRAVEITMPDVKRLVVSGTASIAANGQTAHVGDVMAQTALTCEVIEAILESAGMGWEDVVRATAYVRFAQDADVFKRHCADAGMPPLPVVIAHNVICREELLFELEVDAVQATSAG